MIRRAAPALLMLALGAFVGCSRAPATTMPSRASLERTLCGGRAGCVLHAMIRAGTNDSGESLHVARLDLAPDPEGDCAPREYWSIVDGARGVARRRLIISLCDEGRREQTLDVDVGDNQLTYRYDSGYFTSSSFEARLDPPEILRHGGGGASRSDRRRASGFTWDFGLFEGTIVDEMPLCEGDPDARRECETIGSALEANGPVCSVTSAAFPRVRVADAYARGGFRVASHGRCAIHANTALDGEPVAPSDAALSAVLTPDATYVNVTDDVWSADANETVAGDLLHFYVERTTPVPRVCFSGERHVREITIRIPSGEVVVGGPVAVAVERRGRTAHIAITAPTMDWETIVLTYVDRDDDTSNERTLTTSTMRDGGQLVPQRIYELDEDTAACAVEDGALEVVFREPGTDETLVPSDWLWQ